MGLTVLRDFMMEGIPHSIQNSILTVHYDEEYEQEHAKQISKNIKMLNKCLCRISGNYQATLNVEMHKGISSPRGKKIILDSEELAKIKKRVEQNELVQQTLELFEGEIVDVHG